MNRAALALAGLLLGRIAAAQDLPQGVQLLSRVRAHMSEEFGRLKSISCLETITREHQQPRGKMRPLDTIRLEVLTNGHKEFYASPGDRRFSDDHPMTYAGSGALSDGLFGSYLKDVLSGIVGADYKGEENASGHLLVRYDYRIPPFFSAQRISTPEGSGNVGLRGSYWVDPQTYDVVRLVLDADDFPPSLPVKQMTTSIDYGRTTLANGSTVLLPQAAEFRLAKFTGETDHNRFEFTHCREFGAESTIHFDGPDSPTPTPAFATASVDDILRPLPGDLKIAVKLRSTIRDGAAVGTLIEAIVADNVMSKNSVLIPQGSPVRGRIRRLERYEDPLPYFVVGLEFTEVQVQGIRYLFYADLVDIGVAPGVERELTTKNTTTLTVNPLLSGENSGRQTIDHLSLPTLPGVAAFFFTSSKLELPQDFQTMWKTRLLKH